MYSTRQWYDINDKFNSCMHCRPTLSHSLTAKGIMYCVITKGSQDAMKQGISKQSIQWTQKKVFNIKTDWLKTNFKHFHLQATINCGTIRHCQNFNKCLGELWKKRKEDILGNTLLWELVKNIDQLLKWITNKIAIPLRACKICSLSASISQ